MKYRDPKDTGEHVDRPRSHAALDGGSDEGREGEERGFLDRLKRHSLLNRDTSARDLRGPPYVLGTFCPVPRLRFPLPRQNLSSFPRLLHDRLT